LAFVQPIAAKLRAKPELVEVARPNLSRWMKTCSAVSKPLLDKWAVILEKPLSEVIEILPAVMNRVRSYGRQTHSLGYSQAVSGMKLS
jgi:hypothetical protein